MIVLYLNDEDCSFVSSFSGFCVVDCGPDFYFLMSGAILESWWTTRSRVWNYDSSFSFVCKLELDVIVVFLHKFVLEGH